MWKLGRNGAGVRSSPKSLFTKEKAPYQKELGADCTIPRLHHRPWLANTSCAAQSAIAKSDGRTGMGSQGIARWSALPLCILQDEENQSRQQRIWRTGGNGYRFWPLVQQEMGRIFFFLNLEMGRILSLSFQGFCGTVQVGLGLWWWVAQVAQKFWLGVLNKGNL